MPEFYRIDPASLSITPHPYQFFRSGRYYWYEEGRRRWKKCDPWHLPTLETAMLRVIEIRALRASLDLRIKADQVMMIEIESAALADSMVDAWVKERS